jgi:outer membrane protein TolC
MNRCGRHDLPERSTLFQTALLIFPFMVGGCSQFVPTATLAQPHVARAAGQLPSELPALEAVESPPAASLGVPNDPRHLPINLDTVLRLAEDRNGQIAIARERLREACAVKDLAKMSWLPDLWFGASYYRHEGGIANEDGTLLRSSFGSMFGGVELRGRLDVRDAVFQKISAERRVWQQRGEVTRLTTETMLDAANTYIDLLTAVHGEAIAKDLETSLQDLLKRAEILAKSEPGALVEVARIRTELGAQQQVRRKLREGANSASAKLVYLLGVDPSAELVPMDRQLVAFQLIDMKIPVTDLVAHAQAVGPGIAEMEGVMGLIQDSIDKSRGLGRYMPVLGLSVAEGGFGTGPGDRMNWDNRLDLLVSARWNLTDLLTRRERQRISASKVQQAHLTYHDLLAKLAFGVREAHGTAQSSRDQMDLGEAQIKSAKDAYDRSLYRLTNKIKGYSLSEVLLAIRSQAGAYLGYISAIREYDKAQVRLLILLGQTAAKEK